MSHYNYGIINGANESAPKLGAYVSIITTIIMVCFEKAQQTWRFLKIIRTPSPHIEEMTSLPNDII